MKRYSEEVFDKLIKLIRKDDPTAREWLVDNSYRELVEFWDATDGMEKSFKWLLDNNYRQLAAVVDAMNGNDSAKVFLLKSGNRELAALVDAANGSQKAVNWLIENGYPGWMLIAKEYFMLEKKEKKKGLLWSILNFGNPFR